MGTYVGIRVSGVCPLEEFASHWKVVRSSLSGASGIDTPQPTHLVVAHRDTEVLVDDHVMLYVDRGEV